MPTRNSDLVELDAVYVRGMTLRVSRALGRLRVTDIWFSYTMPTPAQNRLGV